MRKLALVLFVALVAIAALTLGRSFAPLVVAVLLVLGLALSVNDLCRRSGRTVHKLAALALLLLAAGVTRAESPEPPRAVVVVRWSLFGPRVVYVYPAPPPPPVVVVPVPRRGVIVLPPAPPKPAAP